jgi:hypothetical protein
VETAARPNCFEHAPHGDSVLIWPDYLTNAAALSW